MNPFIKSKIYQTRAIAVMVENNHIFSEDVLNAIRKFYLQDWGVTCEEDKLTNEEALKYKDLVLAAYDTCEGKIWITAESTDKIEYDVVTVMFPSDY